MTEPVDFAPWDVLGYPGSTLETTPASSRRSTVEILGPQGRAARMTRGSQKRTDEITSAGSSWVLTRDWRGAATVRDGVSGRTLAEVAKAGWGSRRSGTVEGRAVRWESASLMDTRFRWVDAAGTVLLAVRPCGFLRRHLELTVGAERLTGSTVLLLATLSRHLVADADDARSSAGVGGT